MVSETQACTSLGSTLYDGNNAFDYTNDNKIVELTDFKYFDSFHGYYSMQPFETHHYEIKAGATSTLDPSSLSALHTLQRAYFDAAGRRTQSTVFGSTAGGLTGPMNGTFSAPASYNSTAAENRSDTVLVTRWTFTSDGRLQKTTDVDGNHTEFEYDDMGRKTAMVEDSAGLARRTEYTYNGNSDIVTLTAKNVSGTDQVTEYIYAHGINSRWVTEIHYPNPSTGAASSSSVDKVVYTYNTDGTRATATDQNQTTLTYNYDSLRRQTHQLATATGTGVDTAVLQVVTTYDSSGRVSKLTNRDSATANSGSVVNEVAYTYNGYGQLTKDEQEHAGAVSSSLNVQYAWTEDTADNHSRLDYMTYPNGRTLYAKYTHTASSTWQDETNDAFSRIGQLTNSGGDKYVQYTFAGLSRMTKRECLSGAGWLGNDTVLNLDAGTADQYNGLDFNGRVVKQNVVDGSNTTTRTDIEYSANRDGSPTYAEPQSATVLGRSSYYSEDGLHRLSQVDMGRLNAGKTAVTNEWAVPQSQVYTMDILGNITTLNRKDSGTNANETRTYNATNELTDRAVVGEDARYWVNDDFADNDTVGWATADLNTGGSDGTWGASGAALACSAVVSTLSGKGYSGVPDVDQGSLFLIDGPKYQQIHLKCSATLSSGCDNCGLVFGFVDRLNFWAYIYSKASQTIRVYEVNNGTWTQRSSSGTTITSGVGFTMDTSDIRSGFGAFYTGTMPAGQVGIWCSHATGNSFDNFKCRDIAGPFEADGLYFSDKGEVQVNPSSSGVLRASAGNSTESYSICIPRRGFRGEKYVATFKFKWNGNTSPGFLVRWLDNGNWLAVGVKASDSKAYIWERRDDSYLREPVNSAGALTLTPGTWYTGKVVVDDDPGNAALQQLRFYVDTGGGYVLYITDTTEIDGYWSAGYTGLFCGPIAAVDVQDFDDVKIGIDNSSPKDGDYVDAGDSVVVDDNFNSNSFSLAYDDNGNLTDDGIFKFVYDAWNRMVAVKSRFTAGTTQTTFATYAYDGGNRRTKKIVQNSGVEVVANDGGNTTVNYYYRNDGGLLETRNGSNQTAWQFVLGGSRRQIILADKQGDGSGNDVDPDNTAGGEAANLDHRYFFHQDRNGMVTALTDYAGGNNGKIVERYSYAMGSLSVLKGESSGNEVGNVLSKSTVGNLITHQGLVAHFEWGDNGRSNVGDNGDCSGGSANRSSGIPTFCECFGCCFLCPTITLPVGPPVLNPENPIPPDSPPPDPCKSEEFKKACKETCDSYNVVGITGCFGPKRCGCVCDNNIIKHWGGGADGVGTPTSADIISDCARSHEDTHVSPPWLHPPDGGCGTNPKPGWNPGQPPPPDQNEECLAQTRALHCIELYYYVCSNDQSCLRGLLGYVRSRTCAPHPEVPTPCPAAQTNECERTRDRIRGILESLIR